MSERESVSDRSQARCSLRLRAFRGTTGDDKTGTTVALVVLFVPLGLLTKGKDAKIKPGTSSKVYTDEKKVACVSA